MSAMIEPALSNWQSLSTTVQGRLAERLDEYACHLESGDRFAAERVLAQNPDLTRYFNGHLESLRMLCQREPMRVLKNQNESRDSPVTRRAADTPSTLGDYRIEREIGRGGMGIVYAATQISLRRSVALKVLPFAAVLDQQQVARFRNEAQAAASLHHPHIVPVFAVGCERGVHYYSMQLIDGQTLEQVITEKSRHATAAHYFENGNSPVIHVASDSTLSFASFAALQFPADDDVAESNANASTHASSTQRASTVQTVRNRNYVRSMVELVIHVADALDYAHQQGVIHRDIKPSNLLVDAAGKVWVADFGLARFRGASNLTAQGKIMGTALYMSPEQMIGRSHEVDHRTDIYSLGITLYELLTLQPAFSAPDREQLFRAIEVTDPTPLRRLNPAISIDLETIVSKAIAKQKVDRYGSAAEFAEDLRCFLDGRPTLARRPTVIDRMFKWAMRRQRLVCVALALTFATMMGLTLTTMLVAHHSKLKEIASLQAQHHLDQAHFAVDRFSGLMFAGLSDIPGTDGLRVEMLHEAERYYLDFIRYADDNATMKSELAKVKYRLGAIYARLGNVTAAEDHYQQAITAFDSLVHDEPANSLIQADLALCFHNRAALRKRRGQYAESLRDYQRAADLQLPLTAIDSAHARFFWEAVATKTNLGLLLSESGEVLKAGKLLQSVQLDIEAHLRRSPNDREAKQQLFECRNSLVSILLQQDPLHAEELLRSTISELLPWIESPVMQETPSQVNHSSGLCQLAVARSNLASLLGQRGEVTQGIGMVKESIAALGSEATKHPENAIVREQLAIAHNNLGQLLWMQQPSEAGAEEFLKAESILRIQSPSSMNPETLNRLGNVLHNLSFVDQHEGRLESAVQRLTEAIELQALAVKKAPFNAGYRQSMEVHRQQLDEILHEIQAGNRRVRVTVESATLDQAGSGRDLTQDRKVAGNREESYVST